MQEEHCLGTCSLYVNMRRPMVIRIDDDAQAIEAEDGRHG
jgi:hypothetical protein